jgi:hypothetical protein
MATMRLELRYVQTFNARGHRYYYFRKPGCARIRLPGLPGSTEFMSAYQVALDAAPRIEVGAGRTLPGTVSALVVAYYSSTDFGDLGPATQQYRRWLIEKFRTVFGKHPVKLLEAKHINAMLKQIEKPHMRKQWLKMLRGLMRYAICIGMRAEDPTIGFKIKQRQSDGIPTWGETEIEAFRRHHVLGSRARLAFELLLNTGQRRGDVIRMGRQQCRAARSRSPNRRLRRSSSFPCTPISLKLSRRFRARPCYFSRAPRAGPSPRPASRLGSGSNATPRACGTLALTVSARPPAAASRKPDAPRSRSPPSPGTGASRRSLAIPGPPIKPCWRGRRWTRCEHPLSNT